MFLPFRYFSENGYRMCELVVVGQAFLWHQIRCIVAILFLIAQGKEELEVSVLAESVSERI